MPTYLVRARSICYNNRPTSHVVTRTLSWANKIHLCVITKKVSCWKNNLASRNNEKNNMTLTSYTGNWADFFYHGDGNHELLWTSNFFHLDLIVSTYTSRVFDGKKKLVHFVFIFFISFKETAVGLCFETSQCVCLFGHYEWMNEP